MNALAGRSIELMEELSRGSGKRFGIKNSGYDFVSEKDEGEIFPGAPSQVETLTGNAQIRIRHPYLSTRIEQRAHVRRAGAFDVQALGSWLLSQARRRGMRFMQAEVVSIQPRAGCGYSIALAPDSGEPEIEADQVVLAAGPFINELARTLGLALPVETYLQRKFVMPDPLAVIPRDMPFTIFADSQYLDWNEEERQLISDDEQYRWLLREFPPGLHIKPESKNQIKLGWAFNRRAESPSWEPGDDVGFPSIVLRGASRFIPALSAYLDDIPTPLVQFGGYYTRTADNWPLIGPLGPEGLHVIGALSGFGTMMACAAGELCADRLMDGELPWYAGHFDPGRYGDPAIMKEIAAIESDGQL
jgi:glycine/D-amino acid oxidase-like deaminating enzyme